MHLPSRIAFGLGLSFGSSLACQMDNPAYDLGDSQADAGETRASGDGDASTSAEGNSGDGDGDGDPTTTGDGDPTTSGDGDGDGDPTTGDGDPTTGDGDGDPGGLCGDGSVDPGEECDDGNAIDDDMCMNNCSLPDPGGDGDGDGDGGLEMCVQIVDPMNCPDCLNNFCCFPDAQACGTSPACLCMLPCLANNNGEMACAANCQADPNIIPIAIATLGCALDSCQGFCIGG